MEFYILVTIAVFLILYAIFDAVVYFDNPIKYYGGHYVPLREKFSDFCFIVKRDVFEG